MRILLILLFILTHTACHDLLIDSQCFPHLPECAQQDFDGDGVVNKDDPFPLEISCTESIETICDGVDNDCDGSVDESFADELGSNQAGVCADSIKVCVDSAYAEPDLSLVDGYEAEELSCDGLDNDCDGSVDEALEPPLTDVQVGVCIGAVKVCDGEEGWGEPDYNEIEGYTLDDAEDDDGLDNDCDGVSDEGFCGDGIVNGPEQCDDGNIETEQCEYGECTVCSATCTEVAGEVVGFCGDGIMNGPEQCDGESWCGAYCSGSPPPCASAAGGCPDLDFVTIQGGTYMMGSNDSSSWQPIHSVTLASFEMMRSEITVGQYRLCVNAGACSSPRTGSNFNWSSSAGSKEDHPINGVSWRQVMEFAAWVGARLPTEAEWEYAARGEGQDITYPWGNTSPNCTLVNYDYCIGGTSTVCSHPTGNTEQGLCDMAGNLWEWVQDEYHSNYNDAPNDGSGWCTGSCPENASDSAYNASDSASRGVRGGGWGSSSSAVRSAYRNYNGPSDQHDFIGARLSRSIP